MTKLWHTSPKRTELGQHLAEQAVCSLVHGFAACASMQKMQLTVAYALTRCAVLSCPVLAEHTGSLTKHTCKPLSPKGLVGFSICSGNKSLAGVGSVCVPALTGPLVPHCRRRLQRARHRLSSTLTSVCTGCVKTQLRLIEPFRKQACGEACTSMGLSC